MSSQTTLKINEKSVTKQGCGLDSYNALKHPEIPWASAIPLKHWSKRRPPVVNEVLCEYMGIDVVLCMLFINGRIIPNTETNVQWSIFFHGTLRKPVCINHFIGYDFNLIILHNDDIRIQIFDYTFSRNIKLNWTNIFSFLQYSTLSSKMFFDMQMLEDFYI